MRERASTLAFAVALAGSGVTFACSKHDGAPYGATTPATDPPPPASGTGLPSSTGANAPAVPPPRAGMAWIPGGKLRAGTLPGRIPRIADEELPGTEIELDGFYIDLYPYPNEVGAIPTVNVTRDDASKMCAAKGKRLCTEFEWERSCKGPQNFTYEYGDQYRASACGTGVSVEHAARRPNGEHISCKSGFEVHELHGSVWEWTDSPWRRGTSSPELGVLRGGNARAGELVGRCANAIGRKVSTKSATMGFRCCAGPRNPQENELVVQSTVVLERSAKPAELAAPFVAEGIRRWGGGAPAGGPGLAADGGEVEAGADRAGSFNVRQAWTWRPIANEELVIVTGCGVQAPVDKNASRCGVLVGRPDEAKVIAIDSGRDAADVAQFGEPGRLRMRGLDLRGSYLREIVYAYGRVDVGEARR